MKIYIEKGFIVDEIVFGIGINWLEVMREGKGIYRIGIQLIAWYFNICLEVK